MPVTHTNRKGVIYTLCQGVTKTGQPRYTFARDPQGKPVLEAILDGWQISESVSAGPRPTFTSLAQPSSGLAIGATHSFRM